MAADGGWPRRLADFKRLPVTSRAREPRLLHKSRGSNSRNTNCRSFYAAYNSLGRWLLLSRSHERFFRVSINVTASLDRFDIHGNVKNEKDNIAKYIFDEYLHKITASLNNIMNQYLFSRFQSWNCRQKLRNVFIETLKRTARNCNPLWGKAFMNYVIH